ncbi:MAG: Rhamnosyltransferase WbbL [Candidatus Erwinia impunctatus]|nr:Rhamnosyltransferase WbbL [Culicoides impunctatus]
MIHLSIVSHHHDELIIRNASLSVIAKKYHITIKCNTPASDALISFATENKITLIDENYYVGFGENNNIVFAFLLKNQLITESDYFLVINPDLFIEKTEIEKLENSLSTLTGDIFTINLFYDPLFLKPETSIRHFPSLTGPLKGLLSKDHRSDAYDKNSIIEPTPIDWAAGSFLLFKKQAYHQLDGFSEKYFMYFEDVDICRRAKKMGMQLIYLPDIKAMHKGGFNNRNIFSKHFRWYLKSYLTYHFFS